MKDKKIKNMNGKKKKCSHKRQKCSYFIFFFSTTIVYSVRQDLPFN